MLPLRWIPVLYVAAAIIAGMVIPRIDEELGASAHQIAVGSALALFSAVGSGMIALTGIVFAVGFVMVQFSSGAYSPRLMVVLTGDPRLFHVLGIFMATFTYSLAALAWTDRGGSGRVPFFSSMLVFVLLFASMVAFSRLIHMVGNLQINNVLEVIGRKARAALDSMPPATDGGGGGTTLPSPTQQIVHTGHPRTIVALHTAALLELAQRVDGVIVVDCAVGDTVGFGAKLVHVCGGTEPLPEAELVRALVMGPMRTFAHDPKWALRLLVDIAIRALSPAVNDPTTAAQALDYIEDLLQRLGRAALDTGRIADESGRLRVVFPAPTWEDYLSLSFDEIREFGTSSIQVMRRLRAALVSLADALPAGPRVVAVQQYIDHLDATVAGSAFDPQDRATALQQDPQGLGLSRG